MSLVLAHDRTAEFRSAVRAQLQGMRQRPEEVPKPVSKSERSVFFKQASALAQDIADTAQMTQRLAKLAKRPPMFDDNPHEMEELTSIITQKMASVRNNTDVLEQQLPEMGGAKRDAQADTLSENVVKTIRGRLREMTKNFSSILVERSKIVEASRNRTAQFMAPQPQVTPVSNPLYGENPYGTPQGGANYGENPYAGGAAGSQGSQPLDDSEELLLPTQEQSMVQLEDQQSSYLSHRSSAVDTIEQTINELGQMFGQLTNMLAEQSETVQRIDANTEDISMNVGGAHRELLKFYSRVSSNRGLMLKSFGVIIVMFFLWVMLS